MTEEAMPSTHEILVTPALFEPLNQMVELGGPEKISLVVHLRSTGALSIHLAGTLVLDDEELGKMLAAFGEALSETFSRGEGYFVEDGFEQ